MKLKRGLYFITYRYGKPGVAEIEGFRFVEVPRRISNFEFIRIVEELIIRGDDEKLLLTRVTKVG